MDHLGPVTGRRIHMHAFMMELHEKLFEIKAGDPVIQIARSLANECRVLGFDEFYVSNIADGMLLGRLFQHLFQHGVVIVATSNWPMDQLYPDGRNRKSLLPFIRILENNLQAIDLGDGQDYRQADEGEWPLYLVAPVGSPTSPELARLFQEYAGPGEADAPAVARPIAFAGRCAWYRFADLCEQPLGRSEYLELVRRLDTLVIEGVSVFTSEDAEPALRLVTLIDLCYELNCRVIVSAADYPEQLCPGGPAATAFRRVSSRLAEMQSWG
jgi:cell division protein ZapE